MNILPFSMPIEGSVLSLSVTTSTGSSVLDGTGSQVMFMNAGSTGCHVAIGDAAVEAGTNDIFIPGNTIRVFTIPATAPLYFAGVTASGTTTLLAARGNGA